MDIDIDNLSTAPLIPQQPAYGYQMEDGSESLANVASPAEPEVVTVESQPQATLDGPSEGEGPTKPKGKPKSINLCIYTLKEGAFENIRFETGRLTTAQDILSTMIQRLGLPADADKVFSLWLTSKHLQLQLKSYHLPCKLFKRWKDLLSQYTTCTFEEVCEDEPILSFQRNAFYHVREERKLLKYQDPTQPDNYCLAIDLLFHESVFNTLRGRYPLSEQEFHTLAGLQAAIQFTESGKEPYRPELISQINSFYPPHMQQSRGSLKKISKLFKAKTVDSKQCQEEFLRQHQDAVDKCRDPHQLKCRYLQMCWHKAYYGSVYFRGVVEKTSLLPNNEQVVLAVNSDCIHLLSTSLPSEILLYLTYDQLSWEFKPAEEEGEEFFSSLLLEFDSVLPSDQRKVAKRVQIFSRQAPMMDAMISRCVDCLNVKEEELRQIRLQQGNSEFVDYFFTTHEEGDSVKVQRQEPNYKEHKLKCTVVDPGAPSGAAFTLSRQKKKLSSSSKDELASYNVPSGTLATPLGVAEGDDSTSTPAGEVNIALVVGGGGPNAVEVGQEELQQNSAILTEV